MTEIHGRIANPSIPTARRITVLWDGNPITIEVDAAEVEPLVGMELLAGHDLHIRIVPDGEVTIRAVPTDS